MDKPYKTWVERYDACKNEEAFRVLIDETYETKFGLGVKHSVFGIGDMEAFWKMPKAVFQKLIKSMRFYAKLE